MTMTYEETFYTYRNSRRPAKELLLELDSITEPSAASLAEVEYHMALGHEHYHKRRYGNALTEYKTALGLVYALVQPNIVQNAFLGLDVHLPVDSKLFEPLLETVLSILERVPDTVPKPSIHPPAPVDPPEALRPYLRLGIESLGTQHARDDPAADSLRVADRYLATQQPAQAAPIYLGVLQQVGDDDAGGLRATALHRLGVCYDHMGDAPRALAQLELAEQAHLAAGDALAAAAVREDLSTVQARAGDYAAALESLGKAGAGYRNAVQAPPQRRSSKSVRALAPDQHALNNAEVRLQQRRNAIRSMQKRHSAFGRLTSRIGRSVEAKPVELPALGILPLQRLGTAGTGSSSITLPDAGMQRTLTLALGVPSPSALPVLVILPLQDPKRLSKAMNEIYARRRHASTLAELGVFLGGAYAIDHFRVHVPHHYFFTLQMCLGDVHTALGQYSTALEHYANARDYAYINPQLEAPNTWLRMAECLLAWGRALYIDNKPAEALDRFRQILVVEANGGGLSLPASSPLYHHASFNGVQAKVQPFLATMDSPVPAAINPEVAVVLRKARVYQEMIHAGLNFLGLPFDLIPIFRFRYLQAVARYFAEQAIKAEREHLQFQSTFENETEHLLQLDQAVELASRTVALEQKRVGEAGAEVALASQGQVMAENRKANAEDRKAQYSTVSADRIALDTASAHASGGFTETEGGYSVHLSSTGETVQLGNEDYIILKNAAWHRGHLLRAYELDDMQRTIQEYGDYVDFTKAQVNLAKKREAVAKQNLEIAKLQQSHAQACLAYSNDKTLNAALWSALAQRMREFASLYLDRATEIAFMMQAAYNFENDADLALIRGSYRPGDGPEDLLGGDLLMQDVNYFAHHYIMYTRNKEIPVKTVLSMAERRPFSMYLFRRTGLLQFEIPLADLDRMQPGSFLHRVRSVEVHVEGLVGPDGYSGSIKNSGTSAYRARNGTKKVRVQPHETAYVSSYSLKDDIAIFRPSDEILGLFEGSGVATGWTFALPPDANDIDYASITDIKVVLYYTAFHDPQLEATVRKALPTKGDWSRGLSLRNNRPDAFFLLLETGQAQLDIGRGDFPYNHVTPRTKRFAVQVVAEDGHTANGIQVGVIAEGAGHNAQAKTGPDGTMTSDPTVAGAPLNAFHNDSPIDRWTLALDPKANPELFVEEPPGSGRRRVRGIRDLVIFWDYQHDFRQAP